MLSRNNVIAPNAARVVVTGAGIMALGNGWKPDAEGFRAGRVAFRPVSQFDQAQAVEDGGGGGLRRR